MHQNNLKYGKWLQKIVWNKDFPPLVGESIKYTCDAGGQFNRRADSLDTADYSLQCIEPETFEDPDWLVNYFKAVFTLISW